MEESPEGRGMPAWVTEDAEPEPASLEPAAQPEGRLEAQVSYLT